MRFVPILLALFLISLLSTQSHAELFKNSYVSFELPPNWKCDLDGTEWVCISKFAKQSKEAIIILTAKEVGPTDSIAAYTTYLKTPKSIPDKSGKMTTSQVITVQQRLISNHPWIDGMHKGSEISSYYTRYLATVKERLAILVTFSAHTDHYTKYSSDFLQAVQSLRVVAAKDILENNNQPAMNVTGVRGLPLENQTFSGGGVEAPIEPKGQDLKTKIILVAILLAAIGLYLWRRKKK